MEHLPPKRITAFLEWFINPDYLEDISGDLEEEYQIYFRNHSLSKTRLWYTWQVIRLFRPAMMKVWTPFRKLKIQIDMVKNYIKIGMRNIWKFKASAAINLIGLSTGLASFILIALFVIDELSYDQHHENKDEIFRVTVKNYNSDGSMSRQWAFASAGHAPRIKEDFPEVTHATRFFPWAFPDILIGDSRFPQEQVIFTDPDVFDVFTIPFIIGNAETAFNDIKSIVISESAAIKLYGNNWREMDLLSKTVKLESRGQSMLFNLTGVYENMPEQQHFHFEYLAPFAIYAAIAGDQAVNNVGGNYNYLTYVKTVKGTQPESMEARSNEFFDKYIQPFNGRKASEFYDFVFQPLTSIHLNSNIQGEIENNGSLQQVYIFSVVGILVLIIACINYMNLATAKYSRRMKEIGVRKVVGANKKSLFAQFITESFLITMISLVVGIVLVFLALPYLNDYVSKNLTFGIFEDFKLVILIIVLMIGVGFIAGFYPAIYLSAKNTIVSLKGESGMTYNRFNFRSALVTFQYVVAVGLIFALIVVNSQISFIFNSDPGYDKDQMLNISAFRLGDKADLLKNELINHPNIDKGTISSRIPSGTLADSQGAQFYKGDSAQALSFRLPYIRVDEDFASTFGLELVAGEDFQSYMDVDSLGYYIINEATVKAMGIQDPNEIIGKKLRYGGVDGQIYGVVKDFHFESIHTPIKPMLLQKTKNSLYRITVKMKGQNIKETLKFVEDKWTEIDPINSISYRFLDESFEQQYEAEQRLSTLFKVLTGLVILISCLGMLGLVSFIIERKTKEIGIRKVLGASIQNLMWLVSRNFLAPIILAAVIALPIGFWLMNNWLEQFAYQFEFGLFVFAGPLLIIAAITLLTIGYRALKASLLNPVECLRDE
ncbi:MAG: FtsX-like permease family protein [bacterium]|nr:FtsX-like permease family protein [bacterium]